MSGSNTAKWVVAAAVTVGLLGAGALLYANRDAVFKGAEAAAPAKSELARFAQGSLTRLETPAETPMAPDYGFKDRDGQTTTLAAFRGKVVVVNLWAMWCAPCRTEMPTLARLATAYADRPDMVVLPINVDTTADGLTDARSFIDVHEPLPLYSDEGFKLPFLIARAMNQTKEQVAMPQTVVMDRKGRIRAYFTGEADWSSPEARALVDALLAEPA